MLKLTELVTFAEGGVEAERMAVRAALAQAAAARPGILRTLFEPTLPGHHHGGDLLCHLQFEDHAALEGWRADAAPILCRASVVHVDSAAYSSGTGATRSPGLRSGIYRSLLFCVDPGAPAGSVAELEAQLRDMPNHVPEIRNWSLSRVAQAGGSLPWTHVWEQEFDDLAGLQGPYMAHACHWALVDRWFDPEAPERIVQPALCHSFCAIANSIMAS